MNLTGRIIGVDESGKGDFFGPLVVAGCLVSDNDIQALSDLGVRDSKRLTDNRILSLDKTLRDHFPHAVVVFTPEDYNRYYERIRNLNKLLAEGHARAIIGVARRLEAGQPGPDLAVSDKFGKDERLEDALARFDCHIPVRQIVRGEAVPAVAAASIIARAEFVKQMKMLSETVGTSLPKGAAAQVDEAGRKLVATHGSEVLLRVAKVHFKNYQRVINPDLFV